MVEAEKKKGGCCGGNSSKTEGKPQEILMIPIIGSPYIGESVSIVNLSCAGRNGKE